VEYRRVVRPLVKVVLSTATSGRFEGRRQAFSKPIPRTMFVLRIRAKPRMRGVELKEIAAKTVGACVLNDDD